MLLFKNYSCLLDLFFCQYSTFSFATFAIDPFLTTNPIPLRNKGNKFSVTNMNKTLAHYHIHWHSCLKVVRQIYTGNAGCLATNTTTPMIPCYFMIYENFNYWQVPPPLYHFKQNIFRLSGKMSNLKTSRKMLLCFQFHPFSFIFPLFINCTHIWAFLSLLKALSRKIIGNKPRDMGNRTVDTEITAS